MLVKDILSKIYGENGTIIGIKLNAFSVEAIKLNIQKEHFDIYQIPDKYKNLEVLGILSADNGVLELEV